MKSISYEQSRKNSAHRGRKAKVRQARARGGRARSKPVLGLGRIHLEIGDRIGAMSFGGIGVMRRLVSRLGLVREIDRRLHLLKRHLPLQHSVRGTRLEDLNGLRNNVPYLDVLDAEMIPSPTAAGGLEPPRVISPAAFREHRMGSCKDRSEPARLVTTGLWG